MYSQSDFVTNIKLDNCRELRKKEIEDRKKNRGKYRSTFAKLQRQFRKGKRLNEIRTVSKFYRDGVR